MLLKDNEPMQVPKEFRSNFTKSVTFRLHESQKHWNPATNKYQFPRNRAINSYYTVLMTNKVCEMRIANTRLPQTVGSEVLWKFTPDTIDFPQRGDIVLDPANEKHAEMYWFLFNSPNREGSPNRGEKSEQPIIFTLLDPKKTAQDNIKKIAARQEAEQKILKEWSEEKLRVIAYAMGDLTAGGKEIYELQDFLINIATVNPTKFLEQVSAHDLEMKAAIQEGKSLGVLSYANGTWTWGKESGERAGVEICKNAAGQDEVSRLVKFFNAALKEENEEFFLETLKSLKEKDEKVTA